MKNIFLLTLLFLGCESYASPSCEEFSLEIIKIIKSGEVHELHSYLIPLDQQLTIMSWPRDSSSRAMLSEVRSNLLVEIIASAVKIRQEFQNKGISLADLEYLDCNRNSGRLTDISIKFKVDNIIDSISVPTIETDQIYLISPLKYGKEQTDVRLATRTILDGREFTSFVPRSEEISQGETLLKECQDQKGISNYKALCIHGLEDSSSNSFVQFILLHENGLKAQTVLVNLDTGSCEFIEIK